MKRTRLQGPTMRTWQVQTSTQPGNYSMHATSQLS